MQCSVAANLSGAEFAASLWFAIQQKLQTWQLDYSQLQVYVIFKRSGAGSGGHPASDIPQTMCKKSHRVVIDHGSMSGVV